VFDDFGIPSGQHRLLYLWIDRFLSQGEQIEFEEVFDDEIGSNFFESFSREGGRDAHGQGTAGFRSLDA